MRVYAVGGFSSTSKTYRSKWVYRQFFHGKVKSWNTYGNRPYKVAKLVRNRNLMPEVFFPDTSLFVKGEQLSKELAKVAGVEVVPATLTKVYDLPLDEAGIEMTARSFPHFFGEGFEEWLEDIAVIAPSQLRAISFFEVLVPSQKRTLEQYTADTTCQVPNYFVPYLPEVPDNLLMPTCAEMHRECPLMTFSNYYLCTESVFELIRRYIGDTEIFTIIPLDVPEVR